VCIASSRSGGGNRSLLDDFLLYDLAALRIALGLGDRFKTMTFTNVLTFTRVLGGFAIRLPLA
jgi:hypothetical protein